ncbi:MAG: hypothetical protein AAFQ90_05825, partial [Pseudomonadota bacterium]
WDAFGGEGGEGDEQRIRIYNKCNQRKRFTVNFKKNGRYANYDLLWTWYPGDRKEITISTRSQNRFNLNSGDIITNSPEIYYVDLGANFDFERQSDVDWVSSNRIRIKGSTRTAPLATPRKVGQFYEIVFCDGKAV